MAKKKREFNLPRSLCFILRHKPDSYGIILDEHGYADIDKLEKAFQDNNENVTKADIFKVVGEDDKDRYRIEGNKIRCNFGHSIKVNLDDQVDERELPEYLYHGTSSDFIDSIMKDGLIPRSRAFVHSTTSEKVARQVGMRHAKTEDKLVFIRINVQSALELGTSIKGTNTTTYLSTAIPPESIEVMKGAFLNEK